jgi:hypothetical protein
MANEYRETSQGRYTREKKNDIPLSQDNLKIAQLTLAHELQRAQRTS